MRGLEAAGIDPEQAEAITNAVRDAVTEGTATKGDILRVDNDVNTGFASLNGKVDTLAMETRADIQRLDDKIDGLATKAMVDTLATETRADNERLDDKIEGLATKAMVDTLAAETRADIQRVNDKIDALATKAMVDILATETRADIQRLNDKIDGLATGTKTDIARLETRMMATTIVVAGLIIAAIKYL